MSATVFVTVGTTRFDELISAVQTSECLYELSRQEFNRVVLQFGNGDEPTLPENTHGIEISSFRFKSSLKEDMAAARLIISHAGAGSIMVLSPKCFKHSFGGLT